MPAATAAMPASSEVTDAGAEPMVNVSGSASPCGAGSARTGEPPSMEGCRPNVAVDEFVVAGWLASEGKDCAPPSEPAMARAGST